MRSLRSRLILASALWTAGLLALMHMGFLLVMHMFFNMRGWRVIWPVILGVVLMAAGVVWAQRSLKPLGGLRERLAAVRAGRQRRVEGSYPSEVQPLIDDLNALLEEREQAVRSAFATAGDLAHGLKTPLALLAQEAGRASAAGNIELAESITLQAERMSRQVNYHLARARAAASGPAGASLCLAAPCVEGLVRTVSKLYAARALQISMSISSDIAVRMQQEDLEEIIGNLLDNAAKWAKSCVSVSASMADGVVSMIVEDDGPGLAPDLRIVVLERGVRFDESGRGSGLGLAIVRDLAEIYGGSVSLGDSPLGGLQARLSLPAGVRRC